MPTYLCHGFRWRRRSIRVYVVIQDLDDAAPEWITTPGSARCFIESFYSLFDFLPDCTLPPTGASSAATLPSPSINTNTQEAADLETVRHGDDDEEDDDATSYHTTRSHTSGNASRNSSTSRGRGSSPNRGQGKVTSALHRRQAASITGSQSSSDTSHNNQRLQNLTPSSRIILNKHDGNLLAASHAHHAPPSPPSSQPLLSSLSQLSGAGFGPDSVAAQDWSPVKLLEEYDPSNLDEVSRPHAYVADYITRIDSSCDIFDEIQRYETRVKQDSNPAVTGPSAQDRLSNPEKNTTDHKARSGWLEKLRNQLQVDADVQWYIVVNGGEDRPWPQAGAPKSHAEPHYSVHTSYQDHQKAHEMKPQDLEQRREQLRRELGFQDGGIDQIPERKLERRPRPLDEADLTSQASNPTEPRTATSPKQPKSPSAKRAIKRFFSRSKSERKDVSSS